MTFEFSLSRPSEITTSTLASEPLEDSDEYEYLVMRACGILSEIGCTFHIAGFGSEDWGFDVSYDMSTLMEQLPELLEGLASDGRGEIDFYSQGVERTVTFELAGEAYALRCHSRTNWQPSPEVEYIDSARMEIMLTELIYEFLSGLEAASSEIPSLDPFRAWRSGRRKLF